MRDKAESWADMLERCWERKVERVLRESEMRRREAVSLEILKCVVHCAMSWTEGLAGCCARLVEGAYCGGLFVEKHFVWTFCVASGVRS